MFRSAGHFLLPQQAEDVQRRHAGLSSLHKACVNTNWTKSMSGNNIPRLLLLPSRVRMGRKHEPKLTQIQDKGNKSPVESRLHGANNNSQALLDSLGKFHFVRIIYLVCLANYEMKSNNETHKNDSVGKLRFEASETADRKKLKLNDNLFYIFQGQIRRRLLGPKQRQNLGNSKVSF